IRDLIVTGVQTCALPILASHGSAAWIAATAPSAAGTTLAVPHSGCCRRNAAPDRSEPWTEPQAARWPTSSNATVRLADCPSSCRSEERRGGEEGEAACRA